MPRAVLGTQGLHHRSHLVVTVLRLHGEKMVCSLEVKVSAEPVIEGELVDVACCLELGGGGDQCAWESVSSVSPTQTSCFLGT